MSTTAGGRTLTVIDVPAGEAGVDALWAPLADALDGGAPIAPLPEVSSAAPAAVVAGMRTAVRADAPVLDNTAVVLSTSGSTGSPRGVELSAAALTSLSGEVNGLAGEDPAWVLAIPPTSIGGLNVLVRAQAAGLRPSVVAGVGAQRFVDTAFAEAVAKASGRGRPIAVSLVPAQLPRLLGSDIGREALQRCSLILVGGAALAPQAASDCANAGITVTTTYGMTESSGGCVLDGAPLPGVRIRIDSVDDRLWLSGPMLASGYRDGRNDSFVDGWLRTNDRGRWTGDRLHILGRLDDIVVVNGMNVDLLAVEDRLRQHADLDDVIVVAVSDDASGAQIHAITREAELSNDGARSWVAETLGKAAAPTAVHRADAFVYTASGKIDRRATASSIGLQPVDAGDLEEDLL